MKILLGSHHFFPSMGGIEVVTALLAREFCALGHEVRVVTQTPGEDNFPFSVLRRPGLLELIKAVRWCDVFLQNNISLRTVWPLLFLRRPLFVIHQTWMTDPQGRVGWRERLKEVVLRHATSFAISQAVAESLRTPSITIGNPYDAQIFGHGPVEQRDKKLIFVGRLVSDKGADVLLDALAQIDSKPTLTIAGDGPERANLEEQAKRLNLQHQVDFVGAKSSHELAGLLRRHEMLVVPSRWREPFGIVALEGIASGCVVVGSAEGGLPEAIGPCGKTFPNGDAPALARTISALLGDDSERARLRVNSSAHLKQFNPRQVAAAYLAAMAESRR
jgi:glycosyltransferase involved in cell wall biosynthesis